ncbi:MAG: hypothetical protein ABI443_09645 [Chthoniobacterales bacterium]
MNPKRLILAIIAVFIVVFATNYVIHGIWLMADYHATSSLWRTTEEMTRKLPWMFASEFLFSAVFVMLYAKGFADKRCITCAIMYGVFMGFFLESKDIITYVVTPLPSALAIKWIAAGLGQTILMAIVVFFVYKPAPQKE